MGPGVGTFAFLAVEEEALEAVSVGEGLDAAWAMGQVICPLALETVVSVYKFALPMFFVLANPSNIILSRRRDQIALLILHNPFLQIALKVLPLLIEYLCLSIGYSSNPLPSVVNSKREYEESLVNVESLFLRVPLRPRQIFIGDGLPGTGCMSRSSFKLNGSSLGFYILTA